MIEYPSVFIMDDWYFLMVMFETKNKNENMNAHWHSHSDTHAQSKHAFEVSSLKFTPNEKNQTDGRTNLIRNDYISL